MDADILQEVIPTNKTINIFFIIVFILVSVSQEILCQNTSHLQLDFNQVAQSVKPVVANITAMKTIQPGRPTRPSRPPGPMNPAPNSLRNQLLFARPLNPNTNTAKKIGSGIVIDSRGYILTNYHVTAQAQDIHVTLSGLNPAVPEHFYEAQIVKQDISTDLAIIKIIPDQPLPAAKLGNSDTVKSGDWVLAIGSPFGFEETISAGIISATKRSLSIEGKMYRDLFQTDASINYGNSGGPLVNMNGEVIGINTAIYSPDGTFAGIGFAIPINQTNRLITEATGTNPNGANVAWWIPQQAAFTPPPCPGACPGCPLGAPQVPSQQAALNIPYSHQATLDVVFVAGQKVTAGYLGVTLIPKFCQSVQQHGLMVTGISNGSPALVGGMKMGDVIIRINGKQIIDISDFDSVMDRTRPGDRIRLLVIRPNRPTRQGKKKRLYIKLGRRP